MSRRVYERTPLNCSHPLNRCDGNRCGKCGGKVQTFKPPPPRPFVSQFGAADDAFAVNVERETLARREVVS